MTNEEAIKFGNNVINLGLHDKTQEFCEMAVKAIAQQKKIKANIQEMYISYPVLDKNVCNFYNKIMEIIDKEV